MKIYLSGILLFFLAIGLSAQELSCNITVNSSRIQGTNKDVFTAMQDGMADFMNNTVWTNQVYGATERIECNIVVDISEQLSPTEFKGKLQIQARRPVYGSSYNSVIFNYVDNDVQFTYQEFDPIQVSENTFISNLSSLLSFYAYIIIGLDNDTFALYGGDPFFQRAEKIVNTAQSSGYIGWQASDDQKRRNRYWLVDNLLNTEYKPLRKFYYTYHRHGLDVMEKSTDNGRGEIQNALLELEKFQKNKPDPFTYLLSIMLETKSNEFVEVFSQAPQPEKLKVQQLLMTVDPAGSRKYRQLTQ